MEELKHELEEREWELEEVMKMERVGNLLASISKGGRDTNEDSFGGGIDVERLK